MVGPGQVHQSAVNIRLQFLPAKTAMSTADQNQAGVAAVTNRISQILDA
jgi:hypothetical protein